MLTKEDEKAYFRQKLKPYITEIMEGINARDRRRELYDGIIGTRERDFKPGLFIE